MNALDKLIAAHPLLFRGQEPQVESFLPDGWYAIVDKLCADIEQLLGSERCGGFEVAQVKEKFGGLRFYYRLREGAIISQLYSTREQCLAAEGEGLEVAQVDEAFGALRRYQTFDDDAKQRLRALVQQAEEASTSICERCGAAGQLRRGGWLVTLCERHLAELKAKQTQGPT